MGRSLSPATSYRDLSLWHSSAPDDWTTRPSLPGDTQVDIAIVGAGFTGLWTAYYLLRADPGLRVVVVEAETAGFGASGRNGGWCSALFPTSPSGLAALPGSSRDKASSLHRAMRDTVDEVLRVLDEEGIDAHQHKGGTVSLARSTAQLRRAVQEVKTARAWRRGEDDLRLLDESAAAARSMRAPVRSRSSRVCCEPTRVWCAPSTSFGPQRATPAGSVEAVQSCRSTPW